MTGPPGAAPTYATRPTPGALHDAAAIARLSTVLGRPLMPWQLAVMRVATERHPDDPRRMRYREVRLSVPRQSGKTTGLHVKNVHRTIAYADRQSFYTAQTGKDARERWLDAKTLVERSPLFRFVKPRNPYGGSIKLAAGSPAIAWPNGSQLRPFAPTPASLHGYTPDCVDEDEVWEYDEVQGQALDGAIGPAQITLPHGQRWLISTMGDADSTYWHRLVDEGRAAVDDPDATVAYFEWSLPAGADPYDPAAWAAFHPAVGFTIDVADLAAEAKRQPEATWLRAYCNRRTTARQTVVDMDTFDTLANPKLRIKAADAQLAYDVAFDSSRSSIALAAPTGDDSVAVRIIRTLDGVAQLPDVVVELAARFGLPVVHADDGGPARDVTDQLRRRGVEVDTTGGAQFATACGAWLRRTRDGRLVWDGTADLRDAQAAAVLRPMGDARAFSRSRSGGPIDALVAACVAVRAALLAPVKAPAPMVRV